MSLREVFVRTAQADLVKGIEVPLVEGQCTALVGESGSGKSLTALAIMGLLPNGLRAEGVGLAEIQSKRRAMVFQEPMTALNPTMRVGAQIVEAAMARGDSPEEAKASALSWMSRVQIPEVETSFFKYPHQMSGGQRQRIMIAMAMAQRPELLIADEPTTALDHSVAYEILALLRALQQETGMAMLFISHDLDAVAAVADHVVVLQKGSVVESASAPQLLERPSHPYTQGLLASRPPLERKPLRLPTVQDFLEGHPPSLEERPTFKGTTPLLEVKDLSKTYGGRTVFQD
ncbi:MAG: hypothetical protein RL168_145 [Bacteroidota bacterium]